MPESPKRLTLCFIYQHPRVLLGLKKRGFGEGKWNGFGGKVEPGETVEMAARREMKEECGVEIGRIEHLGEIEFRFEYMPDVFNVAVFRTTEMIGEPIETEEMKPQWFSVDELPYDSMWRDDPMWLPWLLAGKKFRGSFLLDKDNEIATHQLEEVTSL
jgi:8-oxo-dGTP diphosphatase/2-hydroxy-dATP diphosphatase